MVFSKQFFIVKAILKLFKRKNLYLCFDIVLIGDNMARPIGDTPVLYGDEATEFLNHLLDPPSEIQKEVSRRMKSQRIVYFWDEPPKKV